MVSVLFQTESHFPVDRKKVKAAVVAALAGRLFSDTEVSIAIIGNRRMRQLNRMYRKIDETTDVLSFPLNDPATSHAFADSPDGVLRLGDIIVSYPQARNMAVEKGILVDDAIVSLVLHGLAHLMGDHHGE